MRASALVTLGSPMDMANDGARCECIRAAGGAMRTSAGVSQACLTVAFLFFVFCGLISRSNGEEATARLGIYNPLHAYETRTVDDRFSRLLASWGKEESPSLDVSGDVPFLKSLLKELDVPVS